MMRAPRGAVLVPFLLALASLFGGRASAQECYSFRTEACPNKPNIPAWRGKGEDPQKAAARAEAERRAAAKREAQRKAQEEAAKQRAQEEAAKQKAQEGQAPVLPSQPQVQPTSQPQVQPTSQSQVQPTSQPPTQPQAQDGVARARRLRIAGITLLSLGAVGAASGGALVAVDGQPTCSGVVDPNTMCPNVRYTFTGGVAALAVSGAAIVTGTVLIGISARRRGQARLSVVLPAWKRQFALLNRAPP